MFCLCHNCPTLLRFWFQNDLGRENSAIYLKIQAGGRSFLTIVTPWSRSTSNFYALIVQNLTDEFTRKVYAASWNLFTLTAEADRVLCQLVMFLTVFFHWMYKMKYSCYQESFVIHGLLLGFWLRSTSLVKVGNPISDGLVFVFHLRPCLMRKRVKKPQALLALPDSPQELHLEWVIVVFDFCFFISNFMKSSTVYAVMLARSRPM